MSLVAHLLILALAIAGVVALTRVLAQWWVTVHEWERGLLYRNGRFVRELGPGRYWVGPTGGRTVQRLVTARTPMAVPAQEVLSADGFPVKLGAVLEYRVAEARRAHEDTAGQWMEALRIAVQLALRAAAQTRTLDSLLAARDDLSAELEATVRVAAKELGLVVERVALRDLVLPAETRRLVTEVERARRDGLAALERARGEQAALRLLANAARMLKGNPELQVLRLLQALAPGEGRGAPTVVLGANGIVPLRGTGGSGDGRGPATEADSAAPGALK